MLILLARYGQGAHSDLQIDPSHERALNVCRCSERRHRPAGRHVAPQKCCAVKAAAATLVKLPISWTAARSHRSAGSCAEQSLAIVYYTADPTLTRDAMVRQKRLELGEIELIA